MALTYLWSPTRSFDADAKVSIREPFFLYKSCSRFLVGVVSSSVARNKHWIHFFPFNQVWTSYNMHDTVSTEYYPCFFPLFMKRRKIWLNKRKWNGHRYFASSRICESGHLARSNSSYPAKLMPCPFIQWVRRPNIICPIMQEFGPHYIKEVDDWATNPIMEQKISVC